MVIARDTVSVPCQISLLSTEVLVAVHTRKRCVFTSLIFIEEPTLSMIITAVAIVESKSVPEAPSAPVLGVTVVTAEAVVRGNLIGMAVTTIVLVQAGLRATAMDAIGTVIEAEDGLETENTVVTETAIVRGHGSEGALMMIVDLLATVAAGVLQARAPK